MPLKQVDHEEEKPEEEEIIICYNIENEPKEKQSSIAGYSYYTTVDWAFHVSIIENSLLTSLPTCRKTRRAGKYKGYFDFKRL